MIFKQVLLTDATISWVKTELVLTLTPQEEMLAPATAPATEWPVIKSDSKPVFSGINLSCFLTDPFFTLHRFFIMFS